jgi:hypothetical protein
MLGVDAIQRHVVTHAREIHTGAHDIIETLTGRLELARCRVLADLTAEIDETAGINAWESGPTGGASSGEVIVVLLMETPGTVLSMISCSL